MIMNKEVVYAINEVVSKLNELRSDMHELILAVKNPDRQQPQFQQGYPWPQAQPMTSQQQPKSPPHFEPQMSFDMPIFPSPVGHRVSIRSRPIIKVGTAYDEISASLATVRNELKAKAATIHNVDTDIRGNHVRLYIECQNFDKDLNLSSVLERFAHYVYAMMTGTDNELIIRYNYMPTPGIPANM